jgi:phosphoribosylformylglycinamidine synthase
MKAGVITFPGSNCDRDMCVAIKNVTGVEPESIWHQDSFIDKDFDFIALPGGFSYGDYLRSGAIAARSPIIRDLKKFAEQGGLILGVCNGFQVLTETGLLPGTLMRNRDLKFICKNVYLKTENNDTAFTNSYAKDEIISIPVAHHDGSYTADEATLKQLQVNGQIAFTYADEDGAANDNPNGSELNIAGIFNEQKNVLGMMPHPERAVDAINGGTDGVALFESLIKKMGK